MYVYQCVSCSIVVLFNCTLVRSRPDSNEGVGCETQSVETNIKILNGHSKQEIHLERETRRRLSLSLDRGHEGHICEVLQEEGCSSMYKS
jgi:hypothetical protein